MRDFILAGTAVCLVAIAPGSAGAQTAAGDWAGPYVGLSLGSVSGDWVHSAPDGTVNNSGDYSNGGFVGAALGYNFQRGNFVYGGELAYGSANDFCFADYPAECTSNFIDVKARLGYATGPALIYGVLGLSQADYDFVGNIYSLSGTAFGFGLDYMIGARAFVGAEVLRREISNDNFDGGDATDHTATSATLRLGFRF